MFLGADSYIFMDVSVLRFLFAKIRWFAIRFAIGVKNCEPGSNRRITLNIHTKGGIKMALSKCRECGNQVSTEAKTCPQAPPHTTATYHPASSTTLPVNTTTAKLARPPSPPANKPSTQATDPARSAVQNDPHPSLQTVYKQFAPQTPLPTFDHQNAISTAKSPPSTHPRIAF